MGKVSYNILKNYTDTIWKKKDFPFHHNLMKKNITKCAIHYHYKIKKEMYL